MSILNEANEEYKNKNMKFKLFILEKLGKDKKVKDEDEFIKLFLLFKQEEELEKEKEAREEEEQYIQSKNEEIESKMKRPSFGETVIKWLILNDIGFRLFLELKGAPPYVATDKFIQEYYSDLQINCINQAFEKKFAAKENSEQKSNGVT